MTERITDAEWELARRVCTPRQLQVLAWYRQGHGYRTIANMFDLAPGTVRDRVKRAQARMVAAADRQAA